MDPLFQYYVDSTPGDLKKTLQPLLDSYQTGDFHAVLGDEVLALVVSKVLDQRKEKLDDPDLPPWTEFVRHTIRELPELTWNANAEGQDGSNDVEYKRHTFFLAGLAALSSFVQINVTGPPLAFAPANLLRLIPEDRKPSKELPRVRSDIVRGLGADGETAYKLVHAPELLSLASEILNLSSILNTVPTARWAKLRADFLRQRLLSSPAPSIQKGLYADVFLLEQQQLLTTNSLASTEVRTAFLLERAAINTFHGFDKDARSDIREASQERRFDFALTGRLGKRTQFQKTDVSQLVVLAKSAQSDTSSQADQNTTAPTEEEIVRPRTLDLGDDTLLESISFKKRTGEAEIIQDEESLPASLKGMNAEEQPLLNPLDSTILLSLASAIKNTSPDNGLTREETLPYATRVLEGGSSNWQVYTQALLVRSRIEGYSSRTLERGLLQLQALVDQVISDTTPDRSLSTEEKEASTFLPRAKESESALAPERLRYVFSLASPTRWEMESELASRWASLGGLRSALDIYERLEMWAEVALCWAATERDDKARRVIRKQLNHATSGADEDVDEDAEKWEGQERDPLPNDAPRLFCILADVDSDPSFYEKAWEVSGGRYAKAQASLGRHHFAAKNYLKAAHAYSLSLKVNQLNGATWFAMGCALLELGQFKKAAEAFVRTVQLDDNDAEAWSNLAAALLNLNDEGNEAKIGGDDGKADDDDAELANGRSKDPQSHKRDALNALKHASRLKFENYRIWENVLTVAMSLAPPSYTDAASAQKRVIELRGKTDGEKCVDANAIDMLLSHIMSLDDGDTSADLDEPKTTQHGIQRMVVDLIERDVVPLITSSTRLWRSVARLALWRNRPGSALEASEKAWRAQSGQPGWEQHGNEARWNAVVEATLDLVGSYESLGPRQRTEGLAAGSGELVAKDWKFKARSAIRSIKGRAKDSWESSEGWTRLEEALEGLRS